MTVNISFRYQERDYVQGMRAHYLWRLRLKRDFAFILVTFVVGVYLWRSPDSRVLGMIFVGLSVGIILLLAAAFTVFPVIAFRREPKFRDEYFLTFSPTGIHFKTAHIDSQLQWNIYSRALVAPHSYVLYHGRHSVSVIPKRAFSSTEERDVFEQLLTQYVPEIVRQGT